MPYGSFDGYDNGKMAGTVYAETLLQMCSSTVLRLPSHRFSCRVRLHFLPEAEGNDQTGKDVIYRLPSYVSPVLSPRAVSFLAGGTKDEPIGQRCLLPSPVLRLTVFRRRQASTIHPPSIGPRVETIFFAPV